MMPSYIDERRDLAAVFRGAALFNSQGGVCSHFSLRVGVDPLRFLLNPWGMYFSEARASDLMLIDETGKAVTDADIITGPTLIYFGFTFCPDVCPLDSARNAAAVDILETNGQMVTPVFISIDPKRDTPAVVADFTDRLHPRMIGLTGTEDQILAVSKAYKTYFKPNYDGTDYYLVDHSVFTYLVLPGVGFVDYFGRETSPEQMAEKVACFVDRAKGV